MAGRDLDAAGAGELARLETFAAEHRATLCGAERHGGLLAASRTVGGGLAAQLLARTFTRQGLLGATAISRFQVEGMLLDILDDIFLLHLPLEPAKRAFDGFAILYFHFSQAVKHPLCVRLRGGR